jgi:hypothetical protein
VNARAFYGIAGIAFGAVSLTLAACSQPPGGSGASLAPSVAPQAVAHTAAGDSAALVSRSLGTNVRIAIVKDPTGVVAAPNRAWSMLPGTLHVRFTPALRNSDEIQPGLRVALVYRPSDAARLGAGYLPLLAIEYANGRTVRFPMLASLDSLRHTVTVEIPATLLGNAANLTMALGVDSAKHKAAAQGPRYWDGKKWSTTGTIEAGEKTLVLIHGIFSSVETAFPATPTPACPQRIADAGGYKQVLGWDYEWYYPPRIEGPIFFKFLRSIVDAGVTDLDIEAHSYGSLVTLAAIPNLTSLKLGHVVTLGGPLPLRGTPLAKPENEWRMGFVLGVLDTFSDEPPSDVDTAISSGMISSLATDSDALKTILDDVKAMKEKPDFIEAAGDKWICLIGTSSACLFSEDYFKKVLTEGSGVELPWDGVVETLAAESTDIPSPTPTEFPLSHIELPCDKDVIKWVGTQVSPSPPARGK